MVSVLAGYAKARCQARGYHEFLRLLHASVEYANANTDEVFGAVAETTGTDAAEFLNAGLPNTVSFLS